MEIARYMIDLQRAILLYFPPVTAVLTNRVSHSLGDYFLVPAEYGEYQLRQRQEDPRE